MKKAKLFKKLDNGKVKCLACQRFCLILPGQVGFCGARLNKNGNLFSLTYGILNGLQVDPIEKKPLYHFCPGTSVLSIGSYGCNYRCKQCLNHWCSWGSPADMILRGLKSDKDISFRKDYFSPQAIVNTVLNNGYPGIAFTYNEPAIWPEYVYDVASLAKKNGLYTVFVSNGSWSQQCLAYLAPVIDAVNIDIKGFFQKTYQKMNGFFGDILTMTELAVKKYKIFSELTTLIIPNINDSENELKQIANWICDKLGPKIPWHLSKFDPNLANDNYFKKLEPTSITSLQTAYKIGKKAGLKHVYVWAPSRALGESLFAVGDTNCSKCDRLIIKRDGWIPDFIGVKKIKNQAYCKYCHQKLNLVL